MLRDLPGPRGLPILGMAPKFFSDPFGYAAEVARHGDLVRVPFPGAPLIYVTHPSLVEQVMVKQARDIVKGRFMSRVEIVVGQGSFIAEGDAWRRQRLRMAPAFRPALVAQMAPGMAALAQEAVGGWQDGEVRTFNDDMMALTLEIALRALFGATASEEDVATVREAFLDISDFFSRVGEVILQLPMWVPTPANRRFQRARAALDGVVSRILAQRRAAAVEHDDLLGRLMRGRDDEEQGMSEALLQDEVRTLLLAGHETTAVALTTTGYLLAHHPAVQAGVFEEVAALGGAPISTDTPLPRTQAALDEAMRLYPPVPAWGREPVRDISLGGHTIPAGTTLLVAPFIVHRREDLFSDPLRYDPGRWTPAFRKALPRFSFFPFGGGPRVCIGASMAMLEARIVLAEMLRRFALEPADDAPLTLFPSLTLRPTKPVRVRLRARVA